MISQSCRELYDMMDPPSTGAKLGIQIACLDLLSIIDNQDDGRDVALL